MRLPAPHRVPDQGTSFAVAQDTRLAAHATGPSVNTNIRVIDLESGAELWHKSACDDEEIQSLALSPDHKLLASGAGFADPEIRLWDAVTGQELARLTGHRTYIQSLAFSPDGKSLASASADQTIRVWDVSDATRPKTKAVLLGHLNEVHSVAWIPGSTQLVSGDKDGSVCLWDHGRLDVRTTRSPWEQRRHRSGLPVRSNGQSVLVLDKNGAVVRKSRFTRILSVIVTQ